MYETARDLGAKPVLMQMPVCGVSGQEPPAAVAAAQAAAVSGGRDPADTVEDKETALQIHLILHDLPEPYKEVFQLRVFGELPFSQIGFIFGKTENWARVTYHRARMKIQERMEKHG